MDGREYVDEYQYHLPAHRFDRSFGDQSRVREAASSQGKSVLTSIRSSGDRLDNDFFLIILEHFRNH